MRGVRLLPVMLVVARVASAQSVGDWVHAKIAAQRAGTSTPPPTLSAAGQVWSERGPGTAALPRFVPPTSLAPLVKAVRGAVVHISAPLVSGKLSKGSGFIINPDGLVVTNDHVVAKAEQIVVRLADGREFFAQVVGRDPGTDLALLRIPEVKELPTATLGDSDLLEIGDWVVAIGSPLGFEMSVTHGLISARERAIGIGEFGDFLQTNALINPGNSGGPLFDMKGDVVGVTTAMVSEGQGIGFAVPINMVKDLLPNLLVNGSPERGWLGLSLQDVGEGATKGVVIVDVTEGSPAERAGLRPGDRVVAVGGRPVQRYQQLHRRVALQGPGTTLKIDVVRGGRGLAFSATLGARPAKLPERPLSAGERLTALGLGLKPLDPNAAASLGTELGLRVERLVERGPAHLEGLALGDVVVEVNREPVTSLRELDAVLAAAEPGEPVLFRVRRGQSLRYIALTPRAPSP
jgi:serine protease Do